MAAVATLARTGAVAGVAAAGVCVDVGAVPGVEEESQLAERGRHGQLQLLTVALSLAFTTSSNSSTCTDAVSASITASAQVSSDVGVDRGF